MPFDVSFVLMADVWQQRALAKPRTLVLSAEVHSLHSSNGTPGV